MSIYLKLLHSSTETSDPNRLRRRRIFEIWHLLVLSTLSDLERESLRKPHGPALITNDGTRRKCLAVLTLIRQFGVNVGINEVPPGTPPDDYRPRENLETGANQYAYS